MLWASFLSAYELSICMIFRDEARYLPEWIEFHLKQGVEHFYLYDNLSCDHPEEILKPYERYVTLTKWPMDYGNQAEWTNIQCGAYIHCVYNCQKTDQWVAFLDSDEFLFNPDFRPLTEVLKEYEDYGAVGVNWVTYGTSNVTVPEGERLLDHLLYRAPLNIDFNFHLKTIAQVAYVRRITSAHFCLLKGNKIAVDETKEPVNGPFGNKISVNKLRINHYWVRDQNFFHNVKIPRQERWLKRPLREEKIEMEKQYNAVYDPILAHQRE